MGEVVAVVRDPAEIRQFHCLFDGDASVSSVALNLAKVAKFPLADFHSRRINYGLVSAETGLLPADAPIGSIVAEHSETLWLAPELVMGSDDETLNTKSESSGSSENEQAPECVVVSQEECLLHDEGLDLPIEITIESVAHREIESFVSQCAECAGLLLGSVAAERRRRIIHISNSCPALGTKDTPTGLVVTPAAWEHALLTRHRQYPNLRIVGWFHGHHGAKVPFSEADSFVHSSFFPHPNMVAYAIDTVTGRSEFFYWRNGSILRLPQYGRVHQPQTVSEKSRKPLARGWRMSALVLCVALVALAGGLYWGVGEETSRVRQSAPVVRRVKSLTPKKKAQSPLTKPDRVYVLTERDNLWFVCKRFYGDGTLAPILAKYNGLTSVTNLQVGQRIKIPEKSVLMRLSEE